MSLYEPAAQLLNYAREIAVMDEEHFRNHFNNMSDHLKMTLRQNPYINSKPTVCRFPWNPANTAFTTLQERSPPIANAIPESGDLQHPHNLPIPVTPQNQNENTISFKTFFGSPSTFTR
jgi:hypothetical protein